MRYQGGKERVAKDVVAAVLVATPHRARYIEPFLGGASIASRAVEHFSEAVLGDYDDDLIAMWRALYEGTWTPPDAISEERYRALRVGAGSPPERAIASYGYSFGGKKWGGYARANRSCDNYARAAKNGATKKALGLQKCKAVSWHSGDYRAVIHDPRPTDTYYFDPPYRGTTGYRTAEAWDADAFWAECDKLAAVSTVFVSEYQAPPGWQEIWSGATWVTLSKTSNDTPSIERLFMKSPKVESELSDTHDLGAELRSLIINSATTDTPPDDEEFFQ